MILPQPTFRHLYRLSDEVGVFEHACFTTPRREHGYCTDDVSRALIALLREPLRTARAARLVATCFAFLERAQVADGRFHNRLSSEGRWLDEVGCDDCTGRALWALGTAAARAQDSELRSRALALFVAGAGFRSPWPRSNSFALLGAVEVLAVRPGLRCARQLVEAAAAVMGRPSVRPGWRWPEPRLTYANAVLAEVRLAAGEALGDRNLRDEGFELLDWLVSVERGERGLSFAPSGGWAAGEQRPAFDQQPIEAAALADACARAFALSGDPVWARTGVAAAEWFLGANDVGLSLLDPASGGGRDGLGRDYVNENQGAESTICLITALQQGRRLQAAARSAARTSDWETEAAPMQRSAAPYVR